MPCEAGEAVEPLDPGYVVTRDRGRLAGDVARAWASWRVQVRGSMGSGKAISPLVIPAKSRRGVAVGERPLDQVRGEERG